MISSDPLISIIVPVYNMEKYLRRCIDSIINQTYLNIELILVDDGSVDNSLNICKEYAALDNRIVVLHKENGGQGSARNMGLDIAKGAYIAFVDSDDWIVRDMIKFFQFVIKEYGADIVIGKMFRDAEVKQKKITVEILNHDTFYPQLLMDSISSHPCNKLFDAKLWENIRYPSRNSVDDMMIMPKIFEKATAVANTNENVYWYYCDRNDSVSNSNKTIHTNSFERFVAFKERYEIAHDKYLESIRPLILKKAVGFAIGAFGRMYKQKDEYKDSLAVISEFFDDNKSAIQHNPLIDRQRKIAAYLIRKAPGIYANIFSIVKGQ